MKNVIKINKEVIDQKIVSITCDICKNEYKDIFEIQEFHFIKFRSGYGSVFGDDSLIECDICQHCLDRFIGDYCRIDGITNVVLK